MNAGLVVGGPRAGKWLTHHGDFYHVALPPELPALPYGADAPAEPEVARKFTYKFHRGLRGTYEIDFWLPEEADVAWAFRELVGSYQRVNHGG